MEVVGGPSFLTAKISGRTFINQSSGLAVRDDGPPTHYKDEEKTSNID
jgi:hypothetical protein